MQNSRNQLSVRLGLILTTICTAFLVIANTADADVPESPPVEYVVEAGDTLWGIASTHSGPGEDVRRLIRDISDLSGVSAGTIHPGQVLLIPTD